METKIGASSLARSRHSRQPDPAGVWGPLAGLAEATEQVADGRAVVIARGFDRNARQRAKALRELLGVRDIPAVEVTPAPASERLVADTDAAAVVNLIAAGSWQPYRLAARLRVPMLTPKPADTADEVHRDVIGMSSDQGERDVALSHVAVRPEDPAASTLVVTSNGEPVSLPGGWVTITSHEGQLRVHLGGPDFAEQSFAVSQVEVQTLDGPHRLVRDELPIAELEGTLRFAAEPAGLVIRPV